MSLNAYQQVQNVGNADQDNEHRLFMEVTRSLITVKESNDNGPAFFKALDWNRRLWSTLSTDCAIEGNGLPKELRAGIISLGLWVSKYTSLVARGKEDIGALIDINKTIMEGLAEQKRRLLELQKQQAQQAQKSTVNAPSGSHKTDTSPRPRTTIDV